MILFLIGLIVGALAGVGFMAIFQVKRGTEDENT